MHDLIRNTPRYLAFVALLVLLNTGIANYFTGMLPDRAGARETLREVFSGEEGLHIVVVGDSHPMCAVEASGVQGLVNAAWIGQRYDIAYNLTQRLFRRHPGQVEVVVVPLDRHSFARDRLLMPLREPSSRWLEDTLYMGWRTGLLEEQVEALIRYETVPYLGAVDVLLDPSNPRKRLRAYEEDYPRGLADNPDAEGLAAVTAQLHAGSGVWWEEVLEEYLAAILDLCRREGVRVVAVRYPVSAPYWEAVQPLVPLEEWRERVANLLRHYPEVPVLDYSRLAHDRPEFFIDSDHVHPRHAPEFTAKLYEDLMSLRREGRHGPSE